MTEAADLDRIYAYNVLDQDKLAKTEMVKQGAKDLARLVLLSTPEGREQEEALARLEEATFWAVSAIARGDG